MVIETFKDGDPRPIRERFVSKGRMLPPGIDYHGSWIDPVNAQCFQVMEAPNLETLDPWIKSWHDLVDFKVVPVLSSKEYWDQFD
jgi:hypothetical protein